MPATPSILRAATLGDTIVAAISPLFRKLDAMTNRSSRFRMNATRAFLTSLLGAALSMPAIAAQTPQCQHVSGMIVPACDASGCLQGSITGDLQGTYSSVITNFVVLPLTGAYIVTGTTTIRLTSAHGTLTTYDAGSGSLLPDGQPDLLDSTDVLTLTKGTADYGGYSGLVRISGAYPVGVPTPYEGQLCK